MGLLELASPAGGEGPQPESGFHFSIFFGRGL